MSMSTSNTTSTTTITDTNTISTATTTIPSENVATEKRVAFSLSPGAEAETTPVTNTTSTTAPCSNGNEQEVMTSNNHNNDDGGAPGSDSGDNNNNKYIWISSRTTHVTSHLTVLKEKDIKSAPIPDDCLRFVCLSDTHSQEGCNNFLDNIPDGDVLLHAGDFSLHGEVEEFLQFNNFLGRQPHRLKIIIPGNHEDNLDPRAICLNQPLVRLALGMPPCLEATAPSNYEEVRLALASLITNGVLLLDSGGNICGINIYGFPWVPKHGAPGFGVKRSSELREKTATIPEGVDILLSHGPAQGYGDLTSSNKRVGCPHLFQHVTERIKPKLVLSGHIHEGYGVFSNGKTTFINASICNRGYRPKQIPLVVDYHIPEPFSRHDFLNLHHKNLSSFFSTSSL